MFVLGETGGLLFLAFVSRHGWLSLRIQLLRRAVVSTVTLGTGPNPCVFLMLIRIACKIHFVNCKLKEPT